MEKSLHEIMSIRKNKIEQLRQLGVDPFGQKFSYDFNTNMVKQTYKYLLPEEHSSDIIKLPGRIMSIRGHGKAAFATINDEFDSIQIYFKKDVLNDKFDIFKLLDIGDIVGIKGTPFRTQRGELTIKVLDFELLTKSLRPLPEKFHGIQDQELKYRQRYLDLIMNQETKHVFKTRSRIVSIIRNFMDKRNFLEVETPILSPIVGGADARPFATYHNALSLDMYLRIATELNLKKLIVGGFSKVYEIGRIFRNEGIDSHHNPEFTSIELYQAYADYEDLMRLTESLFDELSKINDIKFITPFKRISMNDAVKEITNYDILSMSREDAFNAAKELNVEVSSDDEVGIILNKIFEDKVEHTLITPTFITHHPIEISPLAKTSKTDPGVTDRFELFINGKEIANGFTELNDPNEQLRRFQVQLETDSTKTIDKDFITALEHGMPPTAGLGIGIDRLIMLFTNQRSIRDVLFFPTMKPKELKGC